MLRYNDTKQSTGRTTRLRASDGRLWVVSRPETVLPKRVSVGENTSGSGEKREGAGEKGGWKTRDRVKPRRAARYDRKKIAHTWTATATTTTTAAVANDAGGTHRLKPRERRLYGGGVVRACACVRCVRVRIHPVAPTARTHTHAALARKYARAPCTHGGGDRVVRRRSGFLATGPDPGPRSPPSRATHTSLGAHPLEITHFCRAAA